MENQDQTSTAERTEPLVSKLLATLAPMCHFVIKLITAKMSA